MQDKILKIQLQLACIGNLLDKISGDDPNLQEAKNWLPSIYDEVSELHMEIYINERQKKH